MDDYRHLSLWRDTAGEELVPRTSLATSLDVDVVIVGAGYTGLWTAYYLKESDPSLQVAIVELEVAGFGASGATAGGVPARSPGTGKRWLPPPVVRRSWPPRGRCSRRRRGGQGGVARRHRLPLPQGWDPHLCQVSPQVLRLQKRIEYERSWGFGPEDFSWIPQSEVDRLGRVSDSHGGPFTVGHRPLSRLNRLPGRLSASGRAWPALCLTSAVGW
jgi:hypothetical protein